MRWSMRACFARCWWSCLGPLLPGIALASGPPPFHNYNPPDIPKGAIPAPSGSYVRAFQAAQAHKAEADDFVIYLHEWYKHGPEPGPYGQYHLDLIAKRLSEEQFPVLIQVSGHPELDQARRALVVSHLASAGYPDAEARVILGFPAAGGLYGDEAPRIYFQMLQPQQNRLFNSGFGRNTFGGGQGGFGGFGGGFGGFGGGIGGFGGFGGGFR